MVPQADDDPLITARRAAMNLLARREHSFYELIQKLTQKYPDLDKNEVILPTLEKLSSENLLSDERFVESYVRYRNTRGFGPLKIGMELGKKGVNASLVRQALYNSKIDWLSLCRGTMERKFPEGSADTIERRQKQYRFLSQRGFENDQISQVLGKS